MIIVLKTQTPEKGIEEIRNRVLMLGCQIHESKGVNYHIMGLVGETSNIDPDSLKANPNVEKLITLMTQLSLSKDRLSAVGVSQLSPVPAQ